MPNTLSSQMHKIKTTTTVMMVLMGGAMGMYVWIK